MINREGLQPWKKRLFFDVKPGQEGIFYLKLHVGDEGRFFDKNMYFDLFVYDQKLNTDPIIVHVDRPNKEKETTANITSTIDTSAPTNNRTLQPEAITDRIRVKLGFESDTIQISPSKTALLSPQKGRTEEIAKTHTFTIKNGHIFDGENDLGTFVRLQGHDVDTIWSIENWDHSPGWNPNLNDNMYRDTLELKIEDGKIIIINELPLHHYLNGIAEVSNTDPTEKLRTMMILSRSYALFYMTQAEKFPGKPYHLDDSPERCQNYKGYGLELRAPNMVTSNADTAGMVVTYDGDLIKTPYFNQSDGWTRSAEEVWGWTHTPYLQRVDDSICGKTQRLGHGVGLSGCGATNMAIQGDGFEKIIQYYYQGVEIDNASDL
ncbi:MAG: SpoIID/LytB domain-containing protein [Patescibacteria group bacterium]|nr:SpoIID/LytB domain-containing protein [Patescibacteria group bacterium]